MAVGGFLVSTVAEDVAPDIFNKKASPSESPYWQSLSAYRGKFKTDGEYYYYWDYRHGEIEVIDKRGNPVGTKDPDGKWKIATPPKNHRRVRL